LVVELGVKLVVGQKPAVVIAIVVEGLIVR
jgi:hypothetical protein